MQPNISATYLLAGLIVFGPTVTHAATIYDVRIAWQEALGGQTPFVEEFSGQPTHVIIDDETIGFANGFYLVGDGVGGLAILGFRTVPAMPTPNLETDFESRGTGLIFQFAAPIRAFGFDYAGADFATSILISGVSASDMFPPANTSPNSAAFWGGFLDSPISSFRIATSGQASDQEYFIDNFSFAYAVPAPAAICLLGSALGVLGWVRRRVAS